MAAVRGPSWTRAETLDLLDIWGRQTVQSALRESHRNWDVFGDVSREMGQRGHNKTTAECRNKTKNLRKAYKRALAHNLKSGNSQLTCPFFKELELILRGDPTVKTRRLSNSFDLKRQANNEPKPSTSGRNVQNVNDCSVEACGSGQPMSRGPTLTLDLVQITENDLVNAELAEDSNIALSDILEIDRSLFEDSDATQITEDTHSGPASTGGTQSHGDVPKVDHRIFVLCENQERNCNIGASSEENTSTNNETDNGPRDPREIHPDIPLADLSPRSRMAVRRYKRGRVTNLQSIADRILQNSNREHREWMDFSTTATERFLEEQRLSRILESETRDYFGSIFKEATGVLKEISSAMSHSHCAHVCRDSSKKCNSITTIAEGNEKDKNDPFKLENKTRLPGGDDLQEGMFLEVEDGAQASLEEVGQCQVENLTVARESESLVNIKNQSLSTTDSTVPKKINYTAALSSLKTYNGDSGDDSSVSEEWVAASPHSSPIAVKFAIPGSPLTNTSKNNSNPGNLLSLEKSRLHQSSDTLVQPNPKSLTMKHILFGAVLQNAYGTITSVNGKEYFVDTCEGEDNPNLDTIVPETLQTNNCVPTNPSVESNGSPILSHKPLYGILTEKFKRESPKLAFRSCLRTLRAEGLNKQQVCLGNQNSSKDNTSVSHTGTLHVQDSPIAGSPKKGGRRDKTFSPERHKTIPLNSGTNPTVGMKIYTTTNALQPDMEITAQRPKRVIKKRLRYSPNN